MHPNAKPLEPDIILAALVRNHVECVIIGSFGAIAHGVELDMTDIDLVPKLTAVNVRAIAKALSEIGLDDEHGASPAVIGFLHEMPEFINSNSTWVILTDAGQVDLTTQPDGFPGGYYDLVRNAGGIENNSTVLVACLEDIKRSKEIAGRNKDKQALKMFPVDTPPSRRSTPLPPLPTRDELTTRMREGGNKGELVLKPTTDRRTGKTVMRWMRP